MSQKTPTPSSASKLVDNAKKAQSNLFSFFKKTAPSPNPPPSSSSVITENNENTTTSSSSTTASLNNNASNSNSNSAIKANGLVIIDDTDRLSKEIVKNNVTNDTSTKSNVNNTSNDSKSIITPAKTPDSKKIVRKSMICDDDEDEAEFGSTSVSSELGKRKIESSEKSSISASKTTSDSKSGSKKTVGKRLSKVTSSLDDDEFSDELSGDDMEGSDYSDESEDDDDDDDDDDDEDGFDESEEEDYKPKKKVAKQSTSTKSSAASKSKPPSQSSAASTPAAKANSSRPPLSASSSQKSSVSTPYTPLSAYRADSPSNKSDTSENSYYTNEKYNSNETGVPVLALPDGVFGQGHHEHDKFSFLIDRKDKKGRRPDHPDYNPRTLYIPESVMKQQTPAMQQWWQFKSENMDTVLFFKVGKFYELFHSDADIGMSELDLIYMKGEKAHSGFPEISYGKFASALVAKGYRVARVEQTETPEMLKERNDAKSGGKKEQVVKRELCSIMSQGTRTYCHLDDLSFLEDRENSGTNSSSSVLLSIVESVTGEEGESTVEYGLCCVDTIIGTITLAQFEDDFQRNRFRTFLSRYLPTEVVFGLHNLSAETIGFVKLICPKAFHETLRTEEIIPADKVESSMKQGRYFDSLDNDAKASNNGVTAWPSVLRAAFDAMSDGTSVLMVRSIGCALWQLKRSLIDYEIISLGKVFGYIPPDVDVVESSSNSTPSSSLLNKTMSVHSEARGGGADLINEASSSPAGPSDPNDRHSFMTLDAVALANLEILQNNFDRTEKGSLWSFVNRCNTSFGRRLLKEWLCRPLYRKRDIMYRRDAIEELNNDFQPRLDNIGKLMREMPDLERLLARVHSNGLKREKLGHPDSRAVMYESISYSARKIKDFADLLVGFEHVVKVGEYFNGTTAVNSFLLRTYMKQRVDPRGDSNKMDVGDGVKGGMFPLKEIRDLLRYFREIFDEKQAKRDGQVKPKPGVDATFDAATAEVNELNTFFVSYLRELKTKTGISDLAYFGTGKDRYQVEVPMSQTGKVPKDWISKSQKKTHRRYWTPTIEKKLAELVAAEDNLKESQTDFLRAIFEKFDKKRQCFSDAVTSISTLDALMSLASVSSSPNYVWPNIVSKSSSDNNSIQSQVHIIDGRHPMLEAQMQSRGGQEFIPNSTILGGATKGAFGKEYISKMLLLTGPNMGGKSTLLRQTCLIVILAQLGCRVPASSCDLTPVDRIFTRIGACDRILSGQSTFFVELAETAVILKSATENSLCILDELGRGTATFDGTAIAHAVLHYLVHSSKCISLFATHYHFLVEDWEMDPRVKLGFMDCIVQTGGSSNDMATNTNSVSEEVTFLYKLCTGSSPRSYGINVARLARLPDIVIQIAMEQSADFETRLNNKRNKGDDSGFDEKMKRRMSAYYEKLVSIVNTNSSEGVAHLDVLVYNAMELWRRFKSEFKQ